MDSAQFALLKEKLSVAQSITVLTGAGVSADSGVPTFRGEDGLWEGFRAEELATWDAFQKHPDVVWKWYRWRQEIIATKQPNLAHKGLVAIERKAARFTLITQNVDGLHTKAGSKNVIELHGNIWRTRCIGCRSIAETRSTSSLPTCVRCHTLLRPDIVWFGEEINTHNLEGSIHACRTCEIMLVVGTSGVVAPAASFASFAKEHGAFVIEINIAPSFLEPDIFLQGKAADVIPQLIS